MYPWVNGPGPPGNPAGRALTPQKTTKIASSALFAVQGFRSSHHPTEEVIYTVPPSQKVLPALSQNLVSQYDSFNQSLTQSLKRSHIASVNSTHNSDVERLPQSFYPQYPLSSWRSIAITHIRPSSWRSHAQLSPPPSARCWGPDFLSSAAPLPDPHNWPFGSPSSGPEPLQAYFTHVTNNIDPKISYLTNLAYDLA